MKKFLSLFSLMALLINSIGFNIVLSNFEQSTFMVKGLSISPYSFNPGDTFYFDIISSNTLTEPIKNVFLKLNFQNNLDFTYSENSLKGQFTRINGVNVGSCITSTYNTTTGLNCEITNSSNLQIGAGVNFSIANKSFPGFKVQTTAKNYANNLSSWVEALKTSDNSLVTGTNKSSVIYVNVKPHIRAYDFSKSSVVGNGSDSVDLTVKVKDYNGCSNIDGGIVTANLTSLGLSSSESLTYNSCDVDGKTAIFKKLGITTLSGVGDKIFTYTDFTAIDEDNNYTDPNDSNTTFDDEDKKTNIILTVATPVAPVVTISSTTPTIVGSSGNSTVSFSADKGGTYKVVLNGDGSCSAGTIITDWTAYSTGSTIDSIVNGASLNEGANTVYTCVKTDVGDIGSSNTTITKDITVPTISNVVVSPGSVTTADSSVSFMCNENGNYRVVMNSFDSSYLSTTANTTNTVILPNGNIAVGANTINIYCKDTAGNESNTTSSVSKVQPTPAMTSSGMTLVDNDVDWDGVDGRDLKVTWDSSVATSFAGFESYRIYILPENTAFTGTYLGLVSNSGITTWTGSSNIVNDSLGNPLAGGNYAVYVAIMGTSGELGTPASATGTMIADVIPHPSVLSATFTSTGNLSVKFNIPLKTDTGSQFATGFTYQIGSNTYTGVSVSSISDDTINISINDLGNTYATGILSVATGSVWGVPVDGSYNYGTGGIIITDAINPAITNFSTGTVSPYNGFYSGSLIFNYNISEDLIGGGSTKIEFTRVGGNADTVKTYNITNTTNLTSGAHSETINLVSLGLVSGAYYEARLIVKDLVGNINTSLPISIKFDNSGPNIVSITPFGPQKVIGILNPTFTWFSTIDDNGNGSAVKGYKLRVYTGSTNYTTWHTCTGAYEEHIITNLSDLSKQVNLANLYNYAWGVLAYDNMDNIGVSSTCDNFYIDTNVPTFSAGSIKDTVLNSTTYAKGGDNLVIKATITNSNSGNIYLNASSLKDSSYLNISCSSPVVGVTCDYTTDIATYTFSAGALPGLSSGVKQVQFTAANMSGINTGTYLVSTTLDNVAPIISNVILSGSIFGGTNLPIYFNLATDNIGINYLKFDYSSDGGTIWNNIGTGSNSSPYNWNITSITSGANYKVRVIAYDMVGNNFSAESAIFSIDKVAPVVLATALTYPSTTGIKLKGGQSINITWNTSEITDSIALATNPITLYYSTDSGTNYTQIATSLANNGTYLWNVPSGLNNSTVKIKLEAIDNVGNISSDISDNNFEIDSTSPTINISYAGLGGSTPQTNSYINNSGFDVSATINDTNLAGGNIYYSLYNQTANNYFNGTTYSGSTEVWNLLGASTGSIYNLSSIITSNIISGNYYKLKLKADDVVGNSFSTSQVTYIGDTINPTLNITNASGSYFSGSINISGTSSDIGAGISSTKISIKKGSEYWDGNAWVGSGQLLAINTSNNYANWNYDFVAPGTDTDGQNYEVIVYAYDKSYKVNNVASSNIIIILDKIGPVIESDVFTFISTGFYAGGSNFDITWNPSKITSSGASFSHIKLEYNSGGVFTTIANNIPNNGNYNFTLPSIDNSITIIISAYDELGNISNTVASSSILIDSTPPQIQSIETMDMSANGQIDALKITMSENILDNTIVLGNFNISGVGVPTSLETGNSSNDNIFILRFSDIGDSSTTPTLNYTKGNLTDAAGKFLENVSNFASVDKAVPRILTSEIFANSSGIFNKIEVNFSENISSTTDLSVFTLNNGLTISSVSTIGNKAILNLNLGSVNTDSNGYTLGFTSNANWKDNSNNEAGNLGSPINLIDKAVPVLTNAIIKDTNNNYVADKIELTFSENLTGTISGFSLNTGSLSNPIFSLNKIIFDVSGISGTAPNINFSYTPGNLADNYLNTLSSITLQQITETISPEFLSSMTLDQDGNGKIDGVLLNFSESLNGDFSDFTLGINGYNLQTTPYSLSGTTSVIALLQEKSTYDTQGVPQVSINSNNSLKDLNSNSVLSLQSKISVDNVGPVIVGSRYEPSTHKIFLNFSETINDVDFITTNFVLQNAGSYSIVLVNSGEKSITLSGENINYSASTISFVTNSVGDILGNKQILTHYVLITAPIIINEIMVSTDVNNNYIELHNLSSDIINLNGWIIAGITIPNNNIAANGYYLISKSDMVTSIINVTPDLVTNIDLSGTGIILNNGSIDMDKASLTTGLGNNSIPVSIERKSPVENGLFTSSWYGALTSTGFDNTTPFGTPKIVNVFDTTSPTLNSNMVNNLLLPIGYYGLVYTYSDNILINTGSIAFNLEKWNGSTFVNTTGYTTGTISANTTNFDISGINYGRYKATFSISDSAGNISTDIKEFYVDDFSFTISTGNIDLGELQPNVQKLANTNVVLTVSTIGAGFNLNHIISTNDLGNWTGTGGYGACEGNLCNSLQDYSSKNIVTQVGELQSSGALKIYTYEIKYGSLVDSLKQAGIYNINNTYNIGINY